tara:strand:+ start:18419 stop:19186 length:768 start_codon:yes stop_codon:yes gene_type:complete
VLRKRIIFALIHSNGYFMQSRNFRLQKVGDISWLEKNYKFKEIAEFVDELIVIDATKGHKDKEKFHRVVSRLVEGVFIPVTAGGGVESTLDAEALFNSGADKVMVNTSIYYRRDVVKDIISKYGSQSVVASVDYKLMDDQVVLYSRDGSNKEEITLDDYIKIVHDLGVGEIYFNSINKDGTGFGYDVDIINSYSNKFTMPLIVAGGAGNEKHLHEAINVENVEAVATANLFNFVGNGLPNARKYLLDNSVNLARW